MILRFIDRSHVSLLLTILSDKMQTKYRDDLHTKNESLSEMVMNVVM